MSGTIFADAYRIVRKNVNYGDFHQGAEPDGAPGVIGEDQESSSVRTDFTQSHSIQNGCHGLFSNAEMEVASIVMIGFKVAGSFECQSSFGGRSQVGSSSNQPGDSERDGVLHLRGRVATGHTF